MTQTSLWRLSLFAHQLYKFYLQDENGLSEEYIIKVLSQSLSQNSHHLIEPQNDIQQQKISINRQAQRIYQWLLNEGFLIEVNNKNDHFRVNLKCHDGLQRIATVQCRDNGDYGNKQVIQTSVNGSEGDLVSYVDGPACQSFVKKQSPFSQGVIMSLTPCYSPSCSQSTNGDKCNDQNNNSHCQCYSYHCRSASYSSPVQSEISQDDTWSSMVDVTLLRQLSMNERNRQEAIYELIKTECEYVADLHLINDLYITQLLQSDVMAEEECHDFIKDVFGNLEQVSLVNGRFLQQLNALYQKSHFIKSVGCIVSKFSMECGEHYLAYGKNVCIAQDIVRRQRLSNPPFDSFCNRIQRLPKSRKLSLNSFLLRPTTRLARYPLLLSSILRRCGDKDEEEVEQLQNSVARLKQVLTQMDTSFALAEQKMKLKRLSEAMKESASFSDYSDILQLQSGDRVILKDGCMSLRQGGSYSEVSLLLVDNALLVYRVVDGQYVICYRPAPIYLLSVISEEKALEAAEFRSRSNSLLQVSDDGLKISIAAFGRRKSTGAGEGIQRTRDLLRSISQGNVVSQSDGNDQEEEGKSFALMVHGRYSQRLKFAARSELDAQKWIEFIQRQLSQCEQFKQNVFEIQSIQQDYDIHNDVEEIQCSVCIPSPNDSNYRQMIIFGHQGGFIVSDGRDTLNFTQFTDITQLYHVKDWKLILLLSGNKLLTLTLDSLYQAMASADHQDDSELDLSIEVITNKCSFFCIGLIRDQIAVAVVRTGLLHTYIKLYKRMQSGTNQAFSLGSLRNILKSDQVSQNYECFQRLEIPIQSTSFDFMPTPNGKDSVLVGTVQGYELIDLETLHSQSIQHQSESDDDLVHPLGMFPIAKESAFVLTYQHQYMVVESNNPFRVLTSGQWNSVAQRIICVDCHFCVFGRDMLEIYQVADKQLKLKQVYLHTGREVAKSAFIQRDTIYF
ncbi:hypothetical protein MIR68_005097 [Amoeboaphelidium protococcarum]|nr:hypothetical protein MIR68_005097 [Amoeboaphelidium protococcarum]